MALIASYLSQNRLFFQELGNSSARCPSRRQCFSANSRERICDRFTRSNTVERATRPWRPTKGPPSPCDAKRLSLPTAHLQTPFSAFRTARVHGCASQTTSPARSPFWPDRGHREDRHSIDSLRTPMDSPFQGYVSDLRPRITSPDGHVRGSGAASSWPFGLDIYGQ